MTDLLKIIKSLIREAIKLFLIKYFDLIVLDEKDHEIFIETLIKKINEAENVKPYHWFKKMV